MMSVWTLTMYMFRQVLFSTRTSTSIFFVFPSSLDRELNPGNYVDILIPVRTYISISTAAYRTAKKTETKSCTNLQQAWSKDGSYGSLKLKAPSRPVAPRSSGAAPPRAAKESPILPPTTGPPPKGSQVELQAKETVGSLWTSVLQRSCSGLLAACGIMWMESWRCKRADTARPRGPIAFCADRAMVHVHGLCSTKWTSG